MNYPAHVLEPCLGHTALPVMDIATAHLVMRTHIDCWGTTCPLRRQAKQRLVEAGRLEPRVDGPSMG